MKTGLVFMGLVLGLTAAGQAFSQTAGVVQFVAGDVRLFQPGGAERAARKGVPVNVGDTLTTASGAMAQLKMGDGAIVVVVPQSRVTVAEFRYSGVEDGTEKVRYRLEQGGFRAVTGAIGRTHKKNYLIETPIAHMGVRGTDHETYYFPVTGPASGEDAKPGAYNKVNTGKTFIRTGAGEVEIEPNQVGFVASATDVPVILPTVPGFFNRSIAPRNARPAVDPAPVATQTADVGKQMVETADRQKLVRARGPRIESGGGDGPLVGFTSAAGKIGFASSGHGLSVQPNGAALSNVGGDSGPWGSVNWGTWEGGAAIVGGQATTAFTHVIRGSEMTSAAQLAALAPGVMNATYTHIGGPAPTNYVGGAGKINSLQVDVNFATQQITNYALDLTVIGNWTAKGSGSIAQFTGSSGIALNGNCTGCTPGASPAASGTAHGAFIGPQAERLITTFGLTSAGQAVTGAAYLKP